MLSGCSSGVLTLMPTPALYSVTGYSPIGRVPADERWVPRRVYYATVRERTGDYTTVRYGNAVGEDMSLGLALVGFGGRAMSWGELDAASVAWPRDAPIQLSVSGIAEAGAVAVGTPASEAADAEHAGWFLRDLNEAIESSRDRDVLVYVHGAKTDFYDSVAFAAQLDHFMGRDMTSIAFAWPTRQEIVSYGVGLDVNRAYASADSLAMLLKLLAAETRVRRVHVLCWSAGGRVTTAALRGLGERFGDEGRERLRLGTVYFAAADVPSDDFIEALPSIAGLAERVIVSTSDNDGALKSGRTFMGGERRIGDASGSMPRSLTPERRDYISTLDNLEVVDVSLGSVERGFNIDGHDYWMRHPWASTDVLLSIRTDLPAAERGLERVGPNLWAIPTGLPDRCSGLRRDCRSLGLGGRHKKAAPGAGRLA
jgi:esterase/lipase superfamily enzyme